MCHVDATNMVVKLYACNKGKKDCMIYSYNLNKIDRGRIEKKGLQKKGTCRVQTSYIRPDIF